MLRRLTCLAALTLFVPLSIAAADPVDAFAEWANAQGASETAIAVLRGGALANVQDAERPRDLASNSKVITALCIRALIQDGALAWDTPLSDALGMAAPAATLAELVTHTGGIGPDSTQLRMAFWLNEKHPRHADVARTVLKRVRQSGTRGAFSYNNENYALLGRIIETVTGQRYEVACRARVLTPAGVSGALSPRFGAFAAWGGWRMSMKDHARLVTHWFGPGRPLGMDPLAGPHVEVGRGRFYGLGMTYKRQDDGLVMSHAGAISTPFGPKTGAYMLRLPDGTVASMSYDVAVASPAAFRTLASALAAALRETPIR